MGKVVLAGAGPGDTGLLTLKAYKYIKEADCLVYDRLLSPKLLGLARTDCELIYVGKENHKHVVKQDGINEILYQKSKEYELVVRLKGGDPYVFGRGGEEALYLAERGVCVEVVPGVSSSVAALADAGIPITHRGIAKGFQVITAHSRKDKEADIDYSLLTDETITCVFLMGLQHVGDIAAGLMKAGRRADTPIAVISNGTLPVQQKCIGSLSDIEEKMKSADLKSPAIIVAGDVVNMHDKLDFFENRPLFGRSFIVPYIEEYGNGSTDAGSSLLIRKLEELGADVLGIKTGRIEPVLIEDFKNHICRADWIIFTSKNGVRAFFYNMDKTDTDIRSIAGCRFAVVGRRTAEELGRHGIHADFIPEKETGQGLAEELLKKIRNEAGDKEKCNVCLFASGERFHDVENILQDFCDFNGITAYENKMVHVSEDMSASILESDLGQGIEAVFTSASNVKRLFKALPESVSISRAYSIGKKTTEALKAQDLTSIVEAEESSYEALIDAVCQ